MTKSLDTDLLRAQLKLESENNPYPILDFKINEFINLDFDKYRHSAGISQSDLKLALKSPYNYQYFKLFKKDQKESKSFNFGNLVDTLLTNDIGIDLFYTDSKIISDICAAKPETKTPRATKIYKNWKANLELSDYLISEEDYNNLLNINSRIKSNSYYNYLINNGDFYQPSKFMVCDKTGLLLKGRADIVHKSKLNIAIDVKTTKNIDQHSFERDAWQYGYHIQAAFYKKLFNVDEFMFFLVANYPPYEFALYRADDGMIDAGEHEINTALLTLRQCYEKNTWPESNAIAKNMSLPYYAFDKINLTYGDNLELSN